MTATCQSNKAEEIISRVQNLPSLPAVIQKLIMVLDDTSSSANDIERIVGTDPALTARILKLANSPLYKGVHSVGTISHAVTRLGFWKLRDMAISIGSTDTLSEMANEKTQQRYWHHAVYTATCANILARTCGFPVPEVTFVSGLLHDIGELVFAAVSPEQFVQCQELEPENRLESEEEIFGVTHPRIGSMLLRQWNLPKPLCDTVRLHHTEQVFTSKREPVISVVALADMLSKVHNLGSEPDCSAETLLLVAKRAGMPADQIARVLQQVDEGVADTQKHLEIAGDVSFLDREKSCQGLKVAVVSLDPTMVTWLEQLLSYFGHNPMTLQEFNDNPGAAQLAILDPSVTTSQELSAVIPALEQARERLVVLDTKMAPMPDFLQAWGLPETGLFLTQKEILRYALPGS